MNQRGSDSHTRIVPHDLRLLVLSDALDDIQDLRTRTANRYKALTSPLVEGDKGGRFGKGVSSDDPVAIELALHLEAIREIEKGRRKDLEMAMHEHPLGPFVERMHGLGLVSVGRFLGKVGDLTTRSGPAQIWAYCGLHVLSGHTADGIHSATAGGSTEGGDAHVDDEAHRRIGVAPRRRKGERANWSSQARSAAIVMADCAIKANSPRYKAIYDARREQTRGKVHAHACRNTIKPRPGIPQTNGCGTLAHPEHGAIGSPWKPSHQHADARRVVAKEIIKDLWREATHPTTPNTSPSPATSSDPDQTDRDAYDRFVGVNFEGSP